MANVLNIVSPEFIRAVEDTMDWYDHIAFSFLLVKRGDELSALNWIQQLVKLREEENLDWKRVAVRCAIQSAGMDSFAVTEALFMLKQWKLLGLIGYPIQSVHSSCKSAVELITPTGHLCHFRVGLFAILDQLDHANARNLIVSMNGKSGDYLVDDSHQIVEVAALEWILRGTISALDCTKLTYAFAQLSRNDLAALSFGLQNRHEKINTFTLKDQLVVSSPHGTSMYVSEGEEDPTCSQQSVSTTGYCLIICQKSIYLERDPMLKHMAEENVPEYPEMEFDCRILKETFLSLGYKVEIAENLTNFDLKQKVLDISRGMDWTLHHSLALCFLTHCIQDRVFGCNSLSISFHQDVRKLFNDCHCPDLKGKQKTFIFATPLGSPGYLKYSQHLYSNFLVVCPTAYVLAQQTGGSHFITELCSELKASAGVANDIELVQTAISTMEYRRSLSAFRSRHKWSVQRWCV